MRRGIVLAGLLAAILCPNLLLAQGAKLWRQSHYDQFEKGKLQNVAVDSLGYLKAGPELKSVLLTPSTYVWALTSDRQGNAYLATGSPATVLKVSPDGKSTTLFSTKDMSVQSVAVGDDGTVYAATLPSGKVYRIPPGQKGLNDQTATVVFDPEKLDSKQRPKYIWALALDGKGSLYIATGGPAAIYRVNLRQANSKPQLFFSSDEQHILCLLIEPDGDLLAGSDGSGLVYRIDKEGKGFVIYDSSKREVTALAEQDGRIYVASTGEKTKSTLPPLPVQGRTEITARVTIVTPGSGAASNANPLIPGGSEIDELNAQGAPHRLWSSDDTIVYKLLPTSKGLLAGTGNRGKIFRIQEDGSYADLARADAGQVTGFAATSGGTFVSTSNAGGLYKLAAEPAAQGVYLSDVFDAKLTSMWGRVEVNANQNGGSGNIELSVRSGNVENPERGWSGWTKVEPGGQAPGLPAARFLQWKAVLSPGARLGSVGVNYLTVNVAPVVSDVVVVVGAKVSNAAPAKPPKTVTISLPSASQGGVTYIQDGAGASSITGLKDPSAVTARWAAHDRNGDKLVYDLYVRGDGEQNWRLLKSDLKQTFYSFDSVRLPDGGYRLMVVASDAPSHLPGHSLTGERESEHFVIDTTPPVIGPISAKLQGGSIHVTFTAKDSVSPIVHAQYSLDAGPWRYMEPVGRISDSLVEQYDLTIPVKPLAPPQPGQAARILVGDPDEHILTFRIRDRYQNKTAAKVIVRPAK